MEIADVEERLENAFMQLESVVAGNDTATALKQCRNVKTVPEERNAA